MELYKNHIKIVQFFFIGHDNNLIFAIIDGERLETTNDMLI